VLKSAAVLGKWTHDEQKIPPNASCQRPSK
jgi:hypothetical protein